MALTGNPFIPGNDLGEVASGGLLRCVIASGAATGADTTVTGIKVGDEVHYVHVLDASSSSDVTANVTDVKNGAITVSSGHSGKKLQVAYLSRMIPA